MEYRSIMDTVEKVILKVRKLPPDQIQRVFEFIDELDDDLGLAEDAAIAERRYEAMKKNAGKDLISSEEMRRRLDFS